MANNYTESSSMLTIPKDKHAQAQAVIDEFMKRFEETDDPDVYAEEYCDICVELEESGVWIYGKESFDAEQAADLVQLLLDGLDIDEPFIFSWAHTCSKLRIDEFGGGACLVRKGCEARFIDARQQAEKLLKQLTENL